MNKTELRNEIAKTTGLTQKDAGIVLDATITAIEKGLTEVGRVGITNFGTFEVRDRAGRKGRNPATGEEIFIEARKSPAFRASENLKKIVNQ